MTQDVSASDHQPVFRFAPSPNGALHLGHAYSAILNFEMARDAGGRFLLRMEDIDTDRCSPALEAALLEDLDWLRGQTEKTGGRPTVRYAINPRISEAG